MPKQNDNLKNRLSRSQEIAITVTGRKIRTHDFLADLVRLE